VLKNISGILDPQKRLDRISSKADQRIGRPKDRAVGLSHVPRGAEVFPFLSVSENLMMGPTAARIARRRDDREGVYRLFPRSGSAQPAAGQLSGGEQQMIDIGRALMNRPRCCCLTSKFAGGLSTILVREIFHIRRVNEEQGSRSAGRAERQGGDGAGALRLRAGNRPRGLNDSASG